MRGLACGDEGKGKPARLTIKPGGANATIIRPIRTATGGGTPIPEVGFRGRVRPLLDRRP